MSFVFIKDLIQQLYSPNQPADRILSIQQQLQSFQKETNANVLAHELLQDNDQNVQFFGALTYTVYISNYLVDNKNESDRIGKTISDLMADEIVDACRRSLSLLVIKKLLSNLGKIYIRTLYAPLDSILLKLSQLNLDQNMILQIGLLGCKIISEELNRSEIRITKEKHEIITSSILNGTTKNVLNTSLPFFSDLKIKNMWFECLQSWIFYLSNAEFDLNCANSNLNDYFLITINLLSEKNDTDALNLLFDIYDTNPSLLNNENKSRLDQLIFSDWCINFIEHNKHEHNNENLSKFSKFLTLYLDIDMINLVSKMTQSSFDHKFEFLLYLTNQKGSPIIEESFSVDLLDFWILFTECFINDKESIYLYLSNDPHQIELLNKKAFTYFLKLSEIYWSKCHLLDEVEDFEDEFISFRRDISELFESLYAILRFDLFKNLIKSAISQLNTDKITISSIKSIETSFYLLTAISGILTENHINDELMGLLTELFQTNFLNKIMQITSIDISNHETYKYLIRILIKFLSEIHWFYEHSSGELYLNEILMFLFQKLNVPEYQESSSRAILLITDKCRFKLLNLLNDFEFASTSMVTNKFAVSNNVRSRIIRSYSSILQTIEVLNLKAEKISNFLEIIYKESIDSFELINLNSNNPEILEQIYDFQVSIVNSLVGLSKGLQIPEDWEDFYADKDQLMIQVYNYWKYEDASKFNVHLKCMQIILLFTFPNEVLHDLPATLNLRTSILEQVCNLLKTGLTEPLPGPFVLDYQNILEFIVKSVNYCHTIDLKKTSDHPILNIVELYEALLKSNYSSITISKLTNLKLNIEDLKINYLLSEILFNESYKFNIVEENDIMQAIFKLLSEILIRYPKDFFKTGTFFKILAICSSHLFTKSEDRFVVISLSKFWTNLLYLRKGTLEETNYIRNVLINENYGSQLVYSLVKGFLSTPRSNLEYYNDIFRALVAKYGTECSNWMTQAFERTNQESVNAGKKIIDEAEYRMFIKKLILTRGNRTGNKLIKDFWLKVKGLVDYGTV